MYKVYQILEGETLEQIANKFGTTIDEIKKLNGYTETSFVRVGNYIIVPTGDDSSYTTYTVKRGDTMYNIARNYNFDPETLFQFNGLDAGDYIYPEQTILIPKNKKIYITKDGDTLQSVLNQSGLSLIEFDKLNETIYLLPDQTMNLE